MATNHSAPALGGRQRHYLPPDVAAMLHGARLRRGVSLREMARRIGTSHGYLIALEVGERAPSETMARLMSDAYMLDFAEWEQLAACAVPGVGRDWQAATPESKGTPW
jgi:transcriptional regulator with XRE-family HTH domain